MDFIGIDPHKTSSQICALGEGGELSERRIKTTKAAFDVGLHSADLTYRAASM